MERITELQKRYEQIIKNLRWHIDNNKPTGEEKSKTETLIDAYDEFLRELDVLETKTPLAYAVLTAQEYSDITSALNEILYDPYPESVFLPISEREWELIVNHIKSEGFSIDRISGFYGRMFRKPCQEQAKQILKIIEIKTDETKNEPTPGV